MVPFGRERRSGRDVGSDHDPLDLIEGNLIGGTIVKLGRSWGFMGGDGLGVFDGTSVVEIGGDAGRSKGVATDGRGETDDVSPPLDHAKSIVA